MCRLTAETPNVVSLGGVMIGVLKTVNPRVRKERSIARVRQLPKKNKRSSSYNLKEGAPEPPGSPFRLSLAWF